MLHKCPLPFILRASRMKRDETPWATPVSTIRLGLRCRIRHQIARTKPRRRRSTLNVSGFASMPFWAFVSLPRAIDPRMQRATRTARPGKPRGDAAPSSRRTDTDNGLLRSRRRCSSPHCHQDLYGIRSYVDQAVNWMFQQVTNRDTKHGLLLRGHQSWTSNHKSTQCTLCPPAQSGAQAGRDDTALHDATDRPTRRDGFVTIQTFAW